MNTVQNTALTAVYFGLAALNAASFTLVGWALS